MLFKNHFIAKITCALSLISFSLAAHAFTIRGFNGKCLNVIDSNVQNGTPVVMWDCNGSQNQNWAYQNSKLVGLGGKCLTVFKDYFSNGTPIVVWDCGAYNSQTWSYVNRNLIGIDGRCIDVFDSNSVNGATVENWDCSATASWQKWSMQ
jgi:uncharacterized protein YvpB